MSKSVLLKIESQLRDMGNIINDRLKPLGLGFTLIIFTYGKDGFSSYLSSANRKDMIELMKETIMKLEAGAVAPHGQPNHPANNPGKA